MGFLAGDRGVLKYNNFDIPTVILGVLDNYGYFIL